MSNILDANLVTFGLRFNSLGHTNWYYVCEPIGFDAAKLTTEQEPKRFARQVHYLELDKAKFVDAWGLNSGASQVINPQGDTSTYLDYGLEWLLPIHKEFGFEMDVDFGIFINGVLYQTYGLNADEKDITDGYTYFQCTLIDNGKVADYKRRYDDTLNAFADKGVFEQVVTPIQSFNYLKRATPEYQISKFSSNNSPVQAVATILRTAGGTLGYINTGANNANIVNEYGVEDTLSFISNDYPTRYGVFTPWWLVYDMAYLASLYCRLVADRRMLYIEVPERKDPSATTGGMNRQARDNSLTVQNQP